LKINNHLSQNILENLMPILFNRTIRKMRTGNKIPAVLQDLNVTNSFHGLPSRYFYPAIPSLYI
jgi:hypothetical protein